MYFPRFGSSRGNVTSAICVTVSTIVESKTLPQLYQNFSHPVEAITYIAFMQEICNGARVNVKIDVTNKGLKYRWYHFIHLISSIL